MADNMFEKKPPPERCFCGAGVLLAVPVVADFVGVVEEEAALELDEVWLELLISDFKPDFVPVPVPVPVFVLVVEAGC